MIPFPVQVRAYADRIVIRCDGAVVGEHARRFGRDHTAFDPWHYLPVLVRKPGALRNGAPFRDWSLPPALARIRRRLGSGDQADRQFVTILAAVPIEGFDAVGMACEEALASGAVSADVVLNILARQRAPTQIEIVAPPAGLALTTVPVADCARYDRLRPSHVAEDSRAAP